MTTWNQHDLISQYQEHTLVDYSLDPFTSHESHLSVKAKRATSAAVFFVFVCLSGGGGVLVLGRVFGALTRGPSAFQHRAQCLVSEVGGQRLWLGDTVVRWGHRALSDAGRAIIGMYVCDFQTRGYTYTVCYDISRVLSWILLFKYILTLPGLLLHWNIQLIYFYLCCPIHI